MRMGTLLDGSLHLSHLRVHYGRLANDHDRRLLAPAHAGCSNHAHIAAEDIGQSREQVFRAGQFAGEPIADTHGQARCLLAFPQHFEVMVESGDLEHFRHRNVQLARERDQMSIVKAPIVVVEPVQVLDQQITPVRTGADQLLDFRHRDVVRLPALELTFLLAKSSPELVDGSGGNDGLRIDCLDAHLDICFRAGPRPCVPRHGNYGRISHGPLPEDRAPGHERNHDDDSKSGARMTWTRVLVMGGGDMGSAVAHRLFQEGMQVLICDRAQSPHARRGMAFTDALFEGSATLEGVIAQSQADLQGVAACWDAGEAIPIVTIAESLLLAAMSFDVLVDATMRRNRAPADLRTLARLSIGIGPGFEAGANCDVAIETQWGDSMGHVLYDRPAAGRAGGPHAIGGVTRARFVIAPASGIWRTKAAPGEPVSEGQLVGQLDEHLIRAPIGGFLRGVSHDGVEVMKGHRILEVDPRAVPDIFGLGERPVAVAKGVVEAVRAAQPNRGDDR
jgi:xanthine dehydrogenase accessory factor